MASKASSSRSLVMIVVGLWVGVLLGALVIGGLAFAGVIPLFGTSQAQSTGEVPLAKLESGVPAADFDLENLDGKRVTPADFQGKVVVYNFWATWCGPCVQEMPMFQEYQDRYPNFAMVGIDQEEPADTVKAFLKKLPISYTILLDTDANLSSAYKVMLLPTTIFVDEKGEVRFRHYGIMNEDQLQYYLKTLKVIPND